MSLKILRLPEIGEVIICKSKRNKRINLSVKPPGIIRLSMPEKADFKQAEKFVKSKKNWIKESIEKVKNINPQNDIIDEKTNFKTRNHILKFHTHKLKGVKCLLEDGIINVFYPETIDISDDFIQKCIKKSVDMALKREAQEYLPERTKFLSKKTGLNFKDLMLVSSRRHWGLCTNDNLIKLNVHLMRLPDELIDYVILHELAHIREKNHSPKFYEFLSTLIPDPKGWSKKMKKYSPVRYLGIVNK
ncbi:MAG TPA: SprT family zinc-dependent metalloprotease [Candidatus Gastranaerophilales bacterium]|nr:SprT family zinc-dependent metalloprotease [Candidatus Gastranaerophilales bacterium]